MSYSSSFYSSPSPTVSSSSSSSSFSPLHYHFFPFFFLFHSPLLVLLFLPCFGVRDQPGKKKREKKKKIDNPVQQNILRRAGLFFFLSSSSPISFYGNRHESSLKTIKKNLPILFFSSRGNIHSVKLLRNRASELDCVGGLVLVFVCVSTFFFSSFFLSLSLPTSPAVFK